jgi:hypothetical protein
VENRRRHQSRPPGKTEGVLSTKANLIGLEKIERDKVEAIVSGGKAGQSSLALRNAANVQYIP